MRVGVRVHVCINLCTRHCMDCLFFAQESIAYISARSLGVASRMNRWRGHEACQFISPQLCRSLRLPAGLLPQVTAGHLEAAFRETRPSLSASDVTFYAAVYDAFARPAVALKRAQRATLA